MITPDLPHLEAIDLPSQAHHLEIGGVKEYTHRTLVNVLLTSKIISDANCFNLPSSQCLTLARFNREANVLARGERLKRGAIRIIFGPPTLVKKKLHLQSELNHIEYLAEMRKTVQIQ